MKKLYIRLKSFFNTIQGKIAFYPTLLSIAGFSFAFIMSALEDIDISQSIREKVPQLMLEAGDTALSLLSVCIGGIVSMMVFSFSTVMLLLSQASSNFSPRLLPGLISDKKNQIILGTYLASILYLIFTMFAIEPEDKKYSLPGLSILFGIILTIICLAAFIYFVHNMSQSIQINTILDDIFYKSKKRLSRLIQEESEDTTETQFSDTTHWNAYTTGTSGYFQNSSTKNIINICKEHDTRIYIAIPKGFFVLQHVPFLYSEKKLEEKTVKDILSNINFSRGEFVEDNYILAFKQITEIAVKAMSPGINDPGTAINAIDYLTELFALRMYKNNTGIVYTPDEVSSPLQIAVVSFENLLFSAMASLRTYCAHDPIIVQKLVWMLRYLLDQKSCEDSYLTVIENELKLLLMDAEKSLPNESDWKRIKEMAQ